MAAAAAPFCTVARHEAEYRLCTTCSIDDRGSDNKWRRKHGLTATRIRSALANAKLVLIDGDAEYYIGVDLTGVELEMIIVPDGRDATRMACIHAMPTEYRKVPSNDDVP